MGHSDRDAIDLSLEPRLLHLRAVMDAMGERVDVVALGASVPAAVAFAAHYPAKGQAARAVRHPRRGTFVMGREVADGRIREARTDWESRAQAISDFSNRSEFPEYSVQQARALTRSAMASLLQDLRR